MKARHDASPAPRSRPVRLVLPPADRGAGERDVRQHLDRNMVSAEKGLPAAWDIKTGKNVKWWADVGSQTYAGPVVLGGQVFVGTNNDGLRNPKLTRTAAWSWPSRPTPATSSGR